MLTVITGRHMISPDWCCSGETQTVTGINMTAELLYSLQAGHSISCTLGRLGLLTTGDQSRVTTDLSQLLTHHQVEGGQGHTGIYLS